MLSRFPRALPAAIRPTLRVGRISTPVASHFQPQANLPPRSSRRGFRCTPAARKGIFPDSSDPPAPNPQSNNVAGAAGHVTEPSPLTDGEYHEYAEHYLNVLQSEIEKVQEEGADIEAEYSVRILRRLISRWTSWMGFSSVAFSSPLLPSQNQSVYELLITLLRVGRSIEHHPSQCRHLCLEQATPQQADLAQLPYLWSQAVRLGCGGGPHAREAG